MRTSSSTPDGAARPFAVALALALAWAAAPAEGTAQLSYSRGQPVSPAYEGFEVNPDGSYNLVFGYMNSNWDEELDIPIGPDNYLSPGIGDQGQPTHFLPRRNRFTFKVRVPADFGTQELVWTLRSQGIERMAYASLRQDLLIDNIVIASETGALGAGRSDPETRSNVAPLIELETDGEITARIGEPVTLVARVTDDGLPLTTAARRARADSAEAAADSAAPADSTAAQADSAGAGSGDADADADSADAEPELSPELQALQRWLNEPHRVTVNKAVGLHFGWFVYRGENVAEFDPIQIETWEDSRAWHNSPWSPNWEAPAIPEDGRWVVQVTFAEPGTYTLRGRADDGALYGDAEVTIRVEPLLP